MTSHITILNATKLVSEIKEELEEKIKILEHENKILREELEFMMREADREYDC
jgi:excinuclease UvrABC helicase subunit UvrB